MGPKAREGSEHDKVLNILSDAKKGAHLGRQISDGKELEPIIVEEGTIREGDDYRNSFRQHPPPILVPNP